MSPDLHQAALAAVAALSLAVVVTCSGHGQFAPATSPQSTLDTRQSMKAPASATPSTSASVPVVMASAAPAAPAVAPGSSEPEALALGGFYAALAELSKGQRKDHVRVLWLGDSHTAADYLTHAVRRELQRRFGAGGPGFVRVGLGSYRHAGLKVSRDGPWSIEPVPPPRRSRQDDGVFGLGGLRAVGDASAHARLELTGEGREGAARFEVLYTAPPPGKLELKLGEQRKLATGDPSPPAIDRFTLDGDAKLPLDLTVLGGTVRVFGVIVESDKPGVVLDTAGIDGARVATALAWDRQAFADEVAARKPDLAVIAYGTNEAFDAGNVDRYAGELGELVDRLRLGRPGLDCVILGPPDAGAPTGGSPPRLAEIERVQRESAKKLGCGYYSLRAFMGGAGSYWQWVRENPPLARPDRLHYSPKGYEKLGEGFAAALLAAYDRPR